VRGRGRRRGELRGAGSWDLPSSTRPGCRPTPLPQPGSPDNESVSEPAGTAKGPLLECPRQAQGLARHDRSSVARVITGSPPQPQHPQPSRLPAEDQSGAAVSSSRSRLRRRGSLCWKTRLFPKNGGLRLDW
jgi:hypothetical protein